MSKRIIPCLDVLNGQVVKGVRFQNHQVLGAVTDFVEYYKQQSADELVFYDIAASAEGRSADVNWIREIARVLDIPFCVAGGIRTLEQAEALLNAGADKISINSPALENPKLISILAQRFGSQCVVVGVDSMEIEGEYWVYQYTGSVDKIKKEGRRTFEWLQELQNLGAGEVVLNCMNQDGTRLGYDLKQLSEARQILNIPLIASGGAGSKEHFKDLWQQVAVDGALAAGIFHRKEVLIPELKTYLKQNGVAVRI